MAFTYLTNSPPEEALESYLTLLKAAGFHGGTESVAAAEACGRVTAKAVYARICAPHYPACAMDGIAIKARDSFGATETTPVTLAADQLTVVDTGDPLPEKCDAVVMIEEVIWQENGSARLYAPATPWQHVRQIGEDICAGEMLLGAHMPISPAAIGGMLAAGVLTVEVLKAPVIGIVPTGDEMVPPVANPKPGDIIEFNSAIFSAMLTGWNAQPRVYPIVPDDPEKISSAIQNALSACDVVLLGAGSSAGRGDYARQVIAQIGEVCCHGVAMKPGKPAVLGHCGNKPVIGVPGYPVSGILILETFVKPLLSLWYGMAAEPVAHVKAVLGRSLVSGFKYREYVRVRLGKVGSKLIASPLNRGSGMVTSFLKADGLMAIPQGTEGYRQGDEVDVRLLRPLEALEHTLVAIGSHDPLLDELSDLIHQRDPAMAMNSSHVGSMGGIMAIRRGEAHVAGIHLLDEADGSYNLSYIKKYFPEGGVRLVECVQRKQGLMVAEGNPLRLREMKDLAKGGLRYVNRQKGSGTRLLMDYLCAKQGIDAALIDGYDREEFTHTSVAAQIQNGTADAGMGILSAARLYGLDFLPVCMEQYDLLIPDAAWCSPMVERLLQVLKSGDFRARLEALGGYRINTPGRVRAEL